MELFGEFLGQSPRVIELRETLRQLLGHESRVRRLPPILLQGETGTGKGLIASLIHRAGARHGAPFVDVNCAAIPEALLEAELFGFERGAFTDARQAKAGLLQTANGGTLFLDEIALLPQALQAKLLKVLDERTVRRLGSIRSEPIDVSIVAATNEDLTAAVRAHRFRQDLYHRLAALTLDIPPLRTRREDILLLARHFLMRACVDYGIPGKAFTPDALAALTAYRWPGNIRELANVVERAVLFTNDFSITAAMLKLPAPSIPDQPPPVDVADSSRVPLDVMVETLERQQLTDALELTGWNVSQAAIRLGISRNTIRYRIDKYGLRTTPTRTSRRRQEAVLPPAAAIPGRSPITGLSWERRLIGFLRVTVEGRETPAFSESHRELDEIADKVWSFSGRIEDVSATGIVAAFGLDPTDDGPRHAAFAALAIQKAVGRAPHVDGAVTALRLAMHAEYVHVGTVDGAAQIEVDAKQGAWTVLDALIRMTAPQTILVSIETMRLLDRRFECVASGGVDASGRPAYRLAGYDPTRFGLGGHPVRFVGRNQEIELLRSRLTLAQGGHGQAVGIMGEPGIGKSRLLSEFRKSAGAQSLTYVEGHCQSYGTGIAYLPLIDLLKTYLHVDERDDGMASRDKVSAKLRTLGLVQDPMQTPLMALLGAPPDDSSWDAMDPVQRRQRIVDAGKRLLLRESEMQPLVLISEDLHWIDSATQGFLDSLLNSVPTARMLLLFTYRPEYQVPWGTKLYYTQIGLGPLTRDTTALFLDILVGSDPRLGSIKGRLIERTEGNPFFIEESVRALVEMDVLEGEPGGYRPTQMPETDDLPPTVHAILGSRIDRLPPGEATVLQAAAVIGKDVPLLVLSTITGMADEELRRHLAHLQAAEFLYETSLFPDVEFTFKHALTHDVAYESLPRERRRTLHARIAAALEILNADRLTEEAAQIAHHAYHGEVWDRAVTFFRKAGELAAQRSASQEAVAHFTSASECLRRASPGAVSAEEEAETYLGLSGALMQAEGYRSDKLARATDLLQHAARATGSLLLQGRAALYGAPVFYGIGRNKEYLDMVGQFGSAVSKDENPWLRAGLHVTCAIARHNRGEYVQASELLYGAMDFLRHRSPDHQWQIGGGDLSPVMGSYAVRAIARLGRLEESVQIGIDIERANRTLDHFSRAWALQVRTTAYSYVGDHEAALADAEEIITICRRHGFSVRLGNGLMRRGAARACLGELEQGIEDFQEGRTLWFSTGAVFHAQEHASELGDLLLRAGWTNEVRALLDDVDALVSGTDEAACLAECQRLRGMIAVHDGDAAAAECWFETAIATARKQAAKLFQLRATTQLAALLSIEGRRNEASRRLNEVYTSFTQGHRTPDLHAAKSLLDRLVAS